MKAVPVTEKQSPAILFVDDRKNVRNFWKRELERADYRVLLADDAGAALRALEQEAPDLVVIDIQMRGLEGLDTKRWAPLRRLHIPVIIYTAAKGRPEDSGGWPADAYVDKADDVEKLRSKIEELLGSRRTR